MLDGAKKMDANKIKAQLIAKGIKQVDIARTLGISKGVVSQVISGTRQSYRVQEYIARLLHVPFESLWGRKDL
jgi:predicted transcriptional regulator